MLLTVPEKIGSYHKISSIQRSRFTNELYLNNSQTIFLEVTYSVTLVRCRLSGVLDMEAILACIEDKLALKECLSSQEYLNLLNKKITTDLCEKYVFTYSKDLHNNNQVLEFVLKKNVIFVGMFSFRIQENENLTNIIEAVSTQVEQVELRPFLTIAPKEIIGYGFRDFDDFLRVCTHRDDYDLDLLLNAS